LNGFQAQQRRVVSDLGYDSTVYAHFGENYRRNSLKSKRFQHDKHRKLHQFTGHCNFQCRFSSCDL